MIGIKKLGVAAAMIGTVGAIGISASPASASYTSRCEAIIEQMNEAEAMLSTPGLTHQQYDAAKTLYAIRSAVVAASNC